MLSFSLVDVLHHTKECMHAVVLIKFYFSLGKKNRSITVEISGYVFFLSALPVESLSGV